jgi:hypothetical protein
MMLSMPRTISKKVRVSRLMRESSVKRFSMRVI